MQDIRWRAFWLTILAVFLCLILGSMTSATSALSVFILLLLCYLAYHLFWLQKLIVWLKKPSLSNIPQGNGTWEDIFAALYHEQRHLGRSQTQLTSALDRFRNAASALPDGVVLLNGSDDIEWCNPPAEIQLGLDLVQDVGQPISYLIRHTEFIQYLQDHDYLEPVKLKSLRNSDITLEIQVVPFGDEQKLMICRDISHLEKLEKMRRDFIANVSHELRTPLTVVGGFLETLSDIEGAVPESTRNYFAMMLEQTGRMRRLVEDLLTLSQLESSPSVPQDSEIDIPALLNLVMTDSQGLSHGRHHITLQAEPSLCLTGAAEELHSAFGNLVSNAIRYTPNGGEIALSWQMRGHEAIFSVRDSGIGIEQQHISRLTERFYRVDRSRSRETGGTGLGLSIVKHILTRHQGRLEIQSEYGQGSTFSAVFPAEHIIHKQAALFSVMQQSG